MLTQERAPDTLPTRPVRRVVCVDDESLVRQALHRLLRKEPYEVYFAETPAQALHYVQEYDISLVIADQRMPEMSGLRFLENVRKVSPSTKGLILTAFPESVLEETDPRGPTPPLLAKPWDDETLRRTILSLLPDQERGASKDSGSPGSGEAGWTLPPLGPSPVKSSTFLVPLDGSVESEVALGAIMPLVRRNPDSRIVLVHVIQNASSQSTANDYMARSRHSLAAQKLRTIFWVQTGDPANEILACARASGADLIALASYGRRSLASFFKGSVTERVLRGAETPVLVCRPGMAPRQWKRMMVPLDGTKESESVLPAAVELAKTMEASLSLVRACTAGLWVEGATEAYWSQVHATQNTLPYLQRIAAGIRPEGVEVEVAPLYGSPVHEICRYADNAKLDLICMATHGRRGFRRFLGGSVAEEILPSVSCPVLVTRIAPPSG